MAYISYKDLKVWQISITLTKEIYQLIRTFPAEERYGLADQMKRAAVSISSNIAEGHGRNSNKDFIRFLFIARGPVAELETQIIICHELEIIGYVEKIYFEEKLDLVGRMLSALIKSLSSQP